LAAPARTQVFGWPDGARADDEVRERVPGVPCGGVGVVHRVRVRVQGGRHGRVARACRGGR